VDLPFALPTAVAGIALATLYAPNGPFGTILENVFGVKVGFSALGVVFALMFVGLPFVVRTVQPVLEEIDRETEEVSATLGAGRFRTVTRVILPAMFPAMLTGFALSFARGVGEYGSVIFIANNLPFESEIAPLLIVIKLDEHNYAGATAIATDVAVDRLRRCCSRSTCCRPASRKWAHAMSNTCSDRRQSPAIGEGPLTARRAHRARARLPRGDLMLLPLARRLRRGLRPRASASTSRR
jgi:ABC-type molybdate transport system permease subunit